MSNERRVELHERLVGQIRQFIAGAILLNQRVAERIGLRITDMQCLNVLELLGPLPAGRLAECTGLTTGGVTVMLDRLEKAGYVKRSPNPNDRRSVLVSVVPEKLKKVDEYYAQVHQQTVELLTEFPEEELAIVEKFFAGLNAVRVEKGPKEVGGSV